MAGATPYQVSTSLAEHIALSNVPSSMEINDLECPFNSYMHMPSREQPHTESLSFDLFKMPSSWVVFSTCVIDIALDQVVDWRGS